VYVPATTVTTPVPSPHLDRSRHHQWHPLRLLYHNAAHTNTNTNTTSSSHGSFRAYIYANIRIDRKDSLPDPDGESQLVGHQE
jgi:hypothetical protein